MGSKPKSVKAPEMDIGKDIQQYVSGMSGALPQIFDQEGRFRPEFQKLNLGDIQSFLGGVGGQQGLFGLGQEATQKVGQQLGAARGAEIGQMTGQAGLTRGLMEAVSPEQAAAVQASRAAMDRSQGIEGAFGGAANNMMGQFGSQVGGYGSTLGDISGFAGTTISDAQAQQMLGNTLGGINAYVDPTITGGGPDSGMATQMAQEAFDRRGALSAEQQRGAQQQAREAAAASGRIGGNAAISAEILNREAAMAGRRAEAANMGQQAFAQQMGSAQQRMAAEQALYGQRSGNVERDINLQQARFGQGLGSIQQQLASQQAQYSQRASEQERELARRQNMFSQGIAGGQQRASERQLGFGQMMDIEQQRSRLRGESADARTNLFNQAGSFYAQPGLGMLGSTPLSYQAGQQQLGLGLGAIGAGTPQLFDTAVGLNLGAAQRQNQLSAASANAQAQAARSSGIMGMLGSIGGAALMAPMKGGGSLGGLALGKMGFGR